VEILLLLVLGGLFALFVSNRSLKQRIDWLEQRVKASEGGLIIERSSATRPTPSTAFPTRPLPAERAAVSDLPQKPPTRESEPVAEPVPPARKRETIGALFERLVAGNLLIWIGGISAASRSQSRAS
jgi:hypothetical protein